MWTASVRGMQSTKKQFLVWNEICHYCHEELILVEYNVFLFLTHYLFNVVCKSVSVVDFV